MHVCIRVDRGAPFGAFTPLTDPFNMRLDAAQQFGIHWVMPEKLGEPHWRARAAEARALAEQMGDDDSRRRMLRIAYDYEKLAERAEIRLAFAASRGDSAS